jgi:hypothetical protein
VIDGARILDSCIFTCASPHKGKPKTTLGVIHSLCNAARIGRKQLGLSPTQARMICAELRLFQ